jgi:hypothetical protein
MAQIAATVVGVIAFAAWLFAVVSWIRALSYRAEGVSLGTLLFHVMKIFVKRSFTPEGQRHQKRFLIGFAVFFACVFVVLGLALGTT